MSLLIVATNLSRVNAHTSPGRQACAHRYSSVLVHAGNAGSSDALMRMAVEVANLFGARLLGISTPPLLASTNMTDAEEAAVKVIFEGSASLFEEVSSTVHAGASWRPDAATASLALQRYAWAADLIVAGLRSLQEDESGSDLRALVTQSGRPVLVRPDGVSRCRIDRVAVLWDPTPSCARAVSAALPFLAKADEVLLITGPQTLSEREWALLGDLRRGLELRGINYDPKVEPDVPRGSDTTLTPRDYEADLVVMGAWPHPRWLAFMDPTDRRISELKSLALLAH